MSLQVKRIYEPAAASDGYRVLVDHLWPRGLSKERAAVDEWLREVAPSVRLRNWFAHDPARWTEFKRRYAKELAVPPTDAAVRALRALAGRRRVTLLYAARDTEHNNAVALREYLRRPRRRPPAPRRAR